MSSTEENCITCCGYFGQNLKHTFPSTTVAPRPSANKKPDKFLVLELLQDLDDGDGVDPEDLIFEAEDEGVYEPQGELRKLIRRGLVYLHEGKCRSK